LTAKFRPVAGDFFLLQIRDEAGGLVKATGFQHNSANRNCRVSCRIGFKVLPEIIDDGIIIADPA